MRQARVSEGELRLAPAVQAEKQPFVLALFFPLILFCPWIFLYLVYQQKLCSLLALIISIFQACRFTVEFSLACRKTSHNYAMQLKFLNLQRHRALGDISTAPHFIIEIGIARPTRTSLPDRDIKQRISLAGNFRKGHFLCVSDLGCQISKEDYWTDLRVKRTNYARYVLSRARTGVGDLNGVVFAPAKKLQKHICWFRCQFVRYPICRFRYILIRAQILFWWSNSLL